MKLILDYILSLLYLIYFAVILSLFHIFQVIALNIFGRRAHQRVVNCLNFFISHGWILTGTTINYTQKHKIPEGRNIVFVANHQSMFDIPGIIWFLRKYTPLFVAKKELAKGIPSISYNLRNGGAALINRKDKNQAIKEIMRLATYVDENNFSISIFPEGTRSRTSKLKDFAVGGISAILKVNPNSILVPIAIKNTGRFTPKGVFPLTSFSKLSWTSLKYIETKDQNIEEVVQRAKLAIAQELGQEI